MFNDRASDTVLYVTSACLRRSQVLLGVAIACAWCGAGYRAAPAAALATACRVAPPATTPSTSPPSVSTPTGTLEPPPRDLWACVQGQQITGALFTHWLAIARKGEAPPAPSTSLKGGLTVTKGPTTGSPSKDRELVIETMGFLISADWLIGEARDLRVHVSTSQVRRNFDQIEAMQFSHRGEFEKFLGETGETVSDVLFRVRLNLLSERIQETIAAGHHSAGGRERALARFIRTFRQKWRARTVCARAYAVADCGHVRDTV
jgi:hypothetical protein